MRMYLGNYPTKWQRVRKRERIYRIVLWSITIASLIILFSGVI